MTGIYQSVFVQFNLKVVLVGRYDRLTITTVITVLMKCENLYY